MNYREQYPEIAARFPGVKLDGGGLTPAQGRVVFHQERLFRSTGGGVKAHALYLRMCQHARLDNVIANLTRQDCIVALRLIEAACRSVRMDLFRDVRTGWEALLV